MARPKLHLFKLNFSWKGEILDIISQNVFFALRKTFQTWSRLPGTVWRGLIFFTTDRPHYHRMPPLSGDNHGLSGFCCANGLCVRSPVPPQFAHAHIWWKTAAQYQLRAQGRSFVPGPNKFGWDHREKSRRASTLWDCRGKSRQTGPDVNAGYILNHLGGGGGREGVSCCYIRNHECLQSSTYSS